jgi:hypothetical protein
MKPLLRVLAFRYRMMIRRLDHRAGCPILAQIINLLPPNQLAVVGPQAGAATVLLPELLPSDPALRDLVSAWDRLPEVVRAGIVAMVRSATRG